jgi:hypothetical protein
VARLADASEGERDVVQAPTAAQRRIIEAADPVTGRLRGPATQLTGLVRLGLAFRHPRPPHDSYLTPAGRRWRGTSRQEQTAPEPAGSVFVARTGTEPADSAGTAGTSEPTDIGDIGDIGDGPERARQVRSAWQGLIELRRMTHADAATDRPCSWERTHLVSAAALALEAGGCRPAVAGTGGYRVTDTPQPEAVAVHAPTPEDLRACATVLERAGWQPGEHRDRRTGAHYLLASPRRR